MTICTNSFIISNFLSKNQLNVNTPANYNAAELKFHNFIMLLKKSIVCVENVEYFTTYNVTSKPVFLKNAISLTKLDIKLPQNQI